MKVNLETVVKAEQALKSLTNVPMDYSSAHAVVMLGKELRTHAEFFEGKERELVEKYANKDDEGNPIISENGTFTILRERYADFYNARKELCSVEVEITPRKLKKAPESITPNTLDALMGFLEFPEEEEVKTDDEKPTDA